MREARLVKTGTIDPETVDANKRIRPVTEAGVAAVIASYEEIGVIKDPIDLRQIKGSDIPRLIAGGHRLAAARQLGIEVPYKLWNCTADWAELCELDDNLAGADLNPLDTAIFLARRKAVYEKVHPETKHGVAGATARWNATDNVAVASFATSAAEAMGVSERTIFRLVAVGSALSADEIRWLRAAPKAPTGKDLEALSKIADDRERSRVCIALANGAAKNVASARKAYVAQKGHQPPVKSPNEQALQRLIDAWDRAPLAVRREFIRDRYDQVSELASNEYERREM